MRKELSILAVSILLFASCDVVKETTSPDTITIIQPCNVKDYPSSTEVFRARSVGVSISQPTAKKIASSNARGELGTSIEVLMKLVSNNFVEQIQVEDKKAFKAVFQSKIMEIVKKNMLNTIIVCDELRFNKVTKEYSNYVAIELNAGNLLKKINTKLSSDEELRAKFTEDKFRQIFDEEMKNFDK